MIAIDTGIPIPPAPKRGGRKARYPWRDMQPGDSFFVPGASIGVLGAQASDAGSRLGATFTSRTVEGGVRVWRVS